MPIVALDFGERRIGVAVSDPTEKFALPLRTIVRSDVRADVDEILEIAREHGAETIVVGHPLRLSGQAGPAAEKAAAFAGILRKAFAGAVELVDERMTTALATRALLAADVSRAKRKRVVDQLAAASILETFLARKRARSE